MKLEELGWKSILEKQWDIDDPGCVPARVVEEQKRIYRVCGEFGELPAEISGKMRHEATERGNFPVVGDWVVVRLREPEGRVTIQGILERKSKFSRKTAGNKTSEQVIAANIDTAFVISSINRELSQRRIERYLALIWESGARPVVLLNKADLSANPREAVKQTESAAGPVAVHAISALTGEGMEEIEVYLSPGETLLLLGSSGVGKSTLANRLLGEYVQITREIRKADDRGRHTTASRRLLFLPSGAMLIDTPGMRELQLWEAEPGLDRTFQDVNALAKACRFRDCRHESEPGCAVQKGLIEGTLDPLRLESYQKLRRELGYLARRQDELALLEERKRWKRIHRAMRRDRRRW